ncbi:acetylpolyamine aminohydrolase [Erythrobacter sp. SG61-1L]|uniref:histone deacetylase family protein n=1 Tax=Erythrobacter sp. SG61-1L TaxID=1603897 RepID=UPI0006C90FD9|nr:histone deacetylase family protein [Erythrobacter sp. SG61-1L]KPL66821.1 acetylpolyamine aminohydrolase [Erythrobacter sp. SG61-1L]
MKAFLAEARQAEHYPQHFLVNGVMQPNPETPERIAALKAGALRAGCEMVAPREFGMEAIGAVHTPAYLAFLERAWERWQHIPDAAGAVTPNIHPPHRHAGYPASLVAQAGFHMADASCPIAGGTWQSALWSAWSALSAAEALLGGVQSAYALCRPPGHHAGTDLAGGFCYLNNSAIAARYLQARWPKIAILDVDLHHGNGTQDIFWTDPTVFTASIHCDPRRFYPFFWGYAEEEGEGPGKGFNLNLPLPRGSGDAEFLAALDTALARIEHFAPDALVVALGLDAFEGDPFGGLGVTTGGYGRIGAEIARRLPVPTLLVQEGGYLCPELGDNLTAFLGGSSGSGG